MIGLIKKDLLLIVKSFSPVYFLGLVPPSFVATQNRQFFMPILTLLIAFMFALQVTSTMSLDENVKWRKNVTAMPITVFQEAASKYIVTLLLGTLSSLILLVLGSIIGKILMRIDINNIIMYTFICFTLVLLYNAIAIPVSYKYGTAKSRYFIMLFMGIPISIPYLIKITGLNIDILKLILDTDVFWILIISSILMLLLISLLLSTKTLKGLESGKMTDF